MSFAPTHTEEAIALFAALSLTQRAAQAAEPYEAAMARAAKASEGGDHAGAARSLGPMVSVYPQDYAIALECAWQHFQAGEWDASERAYREALARAPESKDSRIGLAWALVRELRCEAAAAEARKADDSRAKDILAACAPARGWVLSASLLGSVTPNHLIKTGGAGVLASARGPIGDGGTFGVSSRFVRITTAPTSGVAAFDQSDWYFHVGYWGERYGVVVRSAVVADGSQTLKTSGHAGLSAHFSLASVLPAWTGDARVESSVSVYDDGALVRVAPSWATHPFGPLHLIPEIAFQVAGARAYASGSLTAMLRWPAFSAWAGAKYGDEQRPAYLAQSVVYDITEHIAWGTWVGARVQPWSALAFEAMWAFDQLRRTDTLVPAQSGMHSFSIGPVVTF